MAFASVYPLVTARAVAREFTYEVDEGVGVGAIVRVPFGRSRARGIVTAIVDAAPAGRRRAPDRGCDRADLADARRAGAVVGRLLRLDACACARARCAGAAEAAQGASAARRAAVALGGVRAARALAAADRRRRADRQRAGQLPPLRRRPAPGRPRCTSRRSHRCSSAGSARSCSCRRSRSRRRPWAGCAHGSARTSRSCTPG